MISRHYGGLTGLNKAETAAKHGEAQVKTQNRTIKGTVQRDFRPPFFSSFKTAHVLATDQWVRIFSTLVRISLSCSNLDCPSKQWPSLMAILYIKKTCLGSDNGLVGRIIHGKADNGYNVVDFLGPDLEEVLWHPSSSYGARPSLLWQDCQGDHILSASRVIITFHY